MRQIAKITIACLLVFFSTNTQAAKQKINILSKDYFGFEAGSTGWYFWNTNEFWNVVGDKASDGNLSMRFSHTNLASVTYSMKAQVGSTSNNGSLFTVPAGTHTMTAKVWVEPGSTVKEFQFIVKEPWTVYRLKIDSVTPGAWVSLSQEMTFAQDVSSTWQLVVDGSETGASTFYLDEFSILMDVDVPEETPDFSSISTTPEQLVQFEENGNYIMRLKIWKEPETTVKGFYTDFTDMQRALYWSIEGIETGKWVNLEQRFGLSSEIKAGSMRIEVPNEPLLGGGKGTFYIDDMELVFESFLTSVDDEIADQPKILMYPNPSAGDVNFSEIGDVRAILIRTMDGRIVYAEPVETPNLTLHLRHLSRGIYIVDFAMKDGSHSAQKLLLR